MALQAQTATPPQPADWAGFLANVDVQVPPKEIMQAALKFLKDECALPDPQSAVGVQLDDLRRHAKWPAENLAVVGFLGRVANALRGLLAAQAAPAAAANLSPPPAASAADDALRSALQVVTGGQAYA